MMLIASEILLAGERKNAQLPNYLLIKGKKSSGHVRKTDSFSHSEINEKKSKDIIKSKSFL